MRSLLWTDIHVSFEYSVNYHLTILYRMGGLRVENKIKNLVLSIGSDPLAESICIENCNLCIENCPSYGTNARGFDTVNCNKCRVVCPMRFGIKK
ncbi:MAG: hypothetical protein Q8880_12480 [Bacteroidota bacterium]|nr:hypothetical protein [Bacteroidota bacterium]